MAALQIFALTLFFVCRNIMYQTRKEWHSTDHDLAITYAVHCPQLSERL